MIEEKVKRLVNTIDQLHPDDPQIMKYWDKITILLGQDEKETLLFLSECNDSNVISTVSASFMDIAWKLQSKKFIECLDNIEKRFPQVSHMVEAAKNAMLD
jgi:hypothetical protein